MLAENGEAPQLALRLYLHCAVAADAAKLEPITYEFFTQAFVVYEEQVSDSRRQVSGIRRKSRLMFIGCSKGVGHGEVFEREVFESHV